MIAKAIFHESQLSSEKFIETLYENKMQVKEVIMGTHYGSPCIEYKGFVPHDFPHTEGQPVTYSESSFKYIYSNGKPFPQINDEYFLRENDYCLLSLNEFRKAVKNEQH